LSVLYYYAAELDSRFYPRSERSLLALGHYLAGDYAKPNVEVQSREVLRLAPDALQIWKDLAWFHVRLLRFDDARRAASEYVTRAPHDPDFPAAIASAMMGRDRFVEIAAIQAGGAAARTDGHLRVLWLCGRHAGQSRRVQISGACGPR
jgi:hypothetical protein